MPVFRKWGIIPRLVSAVFIGVFSICIVPNVRAGWTDHARRLTGESRAVRKNAITALKSEPQLERELKEALSDKDRFLAFDVIVALELRAMVPTLLKNAANDESGYTYHVLNSLASARDRAQILDAYVTNLRTASPAGKVAILDALSRTSRALPDATVDALFENEMPEVRSAVLSYVRNGVLTHGRREDARRVFSALLDPAYQVRLQALYLVSELPAPLRPKRIVRAALERCQSDPFEAVRAYCQKFKPKSEVE
jgi:hypothetical protein